MAEMRESITDLKSTVKTSTVMVKNKKKQKKVLVSKLH